MLADHFAAEVSAGIAGALFGQLVPIKEIPMAGALKSPKRKTKAKPVAPHRASRIQTIEDAPPDVAPVRAQPDAGEFRHVPLESIDPSESNPRKHFDEGELEALAESIRSAGIIEPLILRRQKLIKTKGDERFEIAAGERRWRAAKLAGLDAVPAIVRRLSDAEVLVMQVMENIQRAGLSAIEEGEGFRILLMPAAEGGGGFTQTSLAKELGCTQAHISNRVRLLDLPDDWQKRVLKGELPPTHARALIPWIKYPQVLKEVADDIKRDGVGTVEEFECGLTHTLHDVTKAIDGSRYSPKLGRSVSIFTPTAEQREKLQIVEVPSYQKGQTEERAFNAKLWEQLQAQHEAETAKQSDKRDDTKAKASKSEKPKALTAAQQKAKEKKLDEQFGRRLDEWRADWFRVLIAGKLTARHWVTYKLALYFLAGGTDSHEMRHHSRGEDLETVLDRMPGRKAPKRRPHKDPYSDRLAELWDQISEPAIDHEHVPQVIVDLIKEWLVRDDEPPEPTKYVPLPVLEGVLLDLKIDLAAEWTKHRAGPLTEAYFRLHTTAQLHSLAKEWGMTMEGTKSGMISLFMAASGHPLPKELREKK